MKINDISTWEAFLAVATHGNFTAASKALRVPTPQISKRVAKLEERLEVRLFQRSTRVVTLTDEGRALVPKVETILEDLQSLESQFEDTPELTGVVRLTCVPFLAHKLLPAVLRRFHQDYPKVRVEVDLSKAFKNLIEQGLDMAIRIETPKDSDLIYKKLAPNHLILCASPSYLEKATAALTTPEDLKHHKLLMLSIHRRVRFQGSQVSLEDFEESRSIVCGNGVFLTDLAMQGFGVLVRSLWDVQKELSTGELVQVLPDHPLETFGHIYVVIPTKRLLAPRVRVLMDYLLEESATWKA